MLKNLACILFLLVFAASATWGSVPPSNHVVVVLEENHNYSDVIGSSAMPYLNSLASQYGLATQYYANTHPSIGNYLMLTTGAVITNDDSFNGTLSEDNIVRHMIQAGKTWKAYAESIPSVGYTGGDSGAYLRRHNPLSFFSDVVNSSSEKQNLVPFTQFSADLAAGQLPDFSFIAPNVNDDAHNGTLQQADAWLKANIAPLIADPNFKKDGLLVILFDESGSDNTNGGGRVAWVVVGPNVKTGYKSGALYQHQSTLRMMMEALGLTGFPAAAAGASDMSEFFTAPTPAPIPPPAPNFTIAATPPTQSITRGQSGTYTVDITPLNGFKSAVTLSCPNLPAGVSCAFNPDVVTPSNGTVKAALTVSTSASADLRPAVKQLPTFAFLLPALGIVVAPTFGRKRKPWIVAAALLTILAMILVGCGGGHAASTSSVSPNPGTSVGTTSTSTSSSGTSSAGTSSTGAATSTTSASGPSSTGTSSSGTSSGGTPPPAPSTVSVEVEAVSGSLQHSTTLSITLQ